MTNEILDTANKLIKPEDITPPDDAIIRLLSDNLQDITPEDVNAMCDEMEEAEKRKEEEKRWEIPQELENFRESWKEKIKYIGDESKEKIIKAAENIPVKVEIDGDGSRLIELKLGGKRWKILDPKLNSHSNDKYKYNPNYHSIKHVDDTVKLGGMWGDDVEKWKNKELKEYVKEKQGEGLHIAKIEEMRELLNELGKEANLKDESDKIAMLMYLTGMDGWYRLSMGYDRSLGGQDSRFRLRCFDGDRRFGCNNDDDDNASLCMIACK